MDACIQDTLAGAAFFPHKCTMMRIRHSGGVRIVRVESSRGRDTLEVRSVTDTNVREEFEPSSNMFLYVDREILNDEMVTIYSTGSVGEPKVLSHIPGFVSPVYMVMLVGGRKRCGNGALWMRRPKAHGPKPFGQGLRSSGRQPRLGCVSSVPSMVQPEPMLPALTAARWTSSS